MSSYQWDLSQEVNGTAFTIRITVDTLTGELKILGLAGSGDINALWLDYPGGDNTTTLPTGQLSLNMNGTGILWDDVAVLSSAGLGPAGTNKATFITEGETLTYSLGALGFASIVDWSVVTFGVRATSVNGDGSVKLVDTTPELVGPPPPPNNPPEITVDAGDSAAEDLVETDAGLTTAGTLTVSDLDGDTLTPSVTGVAVTTTPGVALPPALTDAAFLAMLSLEFDPTDPDTSDGIRLDWSFDSAAEAFNFLTECPTTEEIVLTYTIEVSDGNGGTATQDITITITGSNDAPTVNAPGAPGDDLAGAVTELAATDPGAGIDTLSDSGSFAFFDLDINDVHTVDVTAAAVSGSNFGYAGPVLGSLTVGLGDSATGDGSGTIDWTFDVDDSAIDFLKEGETITQVFTVTITDDCGETVTQDVSITLTGRNENPVANADLLLVSNAGTSVELPASLLLFNDSDDGPKGDLTVTSITGPLWDDDDDATTPDVQSVDYDPVTGLFTFNSDAIGELEDEEAALAYTVADGEGGTATGTVTVRLVNTSTDPDTVVLEDALQPGEDSYTASYISLNNGTDTATGQATAVVGNAQVDYLFGDNNNDTLTGGAGNDVLTGGTGNDQYRIIAPADNGSDELRSFGTGNDRIALLQGGGGWNAAGTTPGSGASANLGGGDYLTVATIGNFAAAAKNNKVVELGEAVTNAGIAALDSTTADNAYVLLFNSDSGRGELWYDGNWSTADDRFKIATISSYQTLAAVTGANQAQFAEWAL